MDITEACLFSSRDLILRTLRENPTFTKAYKRLSTEEFLELYAFSFAYLWAAMTEMAREAVLKQAPTRKLAEDEYESLCGQAVLAHAYDQMFPDFSIRVAGVVARERKQTKPLQLLYRLYCAYCDPCVIDPAPPTDTDAKLLIATSMVSCNELTDAIVRNAIA
jgi:hypothetical protein